MRQRRLLAMGLFFYSQSRDTTKSNPKIHRRISRAVRAGVEGLEPRLFLSTAPDSSWFLKQGFSAIDWQGHSSYVAPNQWIVKLKNDRQVAAASVGLSGKARVQRELDRQGTALIESTLPYTQLLASVRKLSGFEYLEPNFALYADSLTPNDPQFNQDYGLHNTGQSGGTTNADINAPEAWNITTGSSDVVVGVIDSGVDYTHPDLSANIWTNQGEIPGDGIDNDSNGYVDDVHGWDFVNHDNNPMDDLRHGTHIAGTIGAVGNNGIGVAGVNWNVKIVPLKFLDNTGGGSTADAISALKYATNLRLHGVNIRLTSNSWGGGQYSQSLYDAIKASGDAGMLFVAAAGNYNQNADTNPWYPAAYDLPNIISVAATDRKDARASFSNYGAISVDIGAPGVDVISTLPGNAYGPLSGTSMATPHVSGVAALAWSLRPNATWQQVKSAIFDGADAIPALAGITTTGKRLNAFGALTQMGLSVIGSTPNVGSILTTLPTSFTLNFSTAIDPISLSANDLLVNGLPADSVAFDAGLPSQAVFSFLASPVTVQGQQTMTVSAGAITRASDQDGVSAWSGGFRYAAQLLTISSIVPTSGWFTTLPLANIVVNYNQPIDPASVQASDLIINQGQVVAATVLDTNKVQFDLAGVLNEGTLSVSIPAGRVTDVYGNPNLVYNGSISLDVSTQPMPMAWRELDPLGSRAYERSVTARLAFSTDVDPFTIDVPDGSLLSATFTQISSATMSPTLELLDPTNTVIASVSGASLPKKLALPLTAITTGGTYTLRVSGSPISGDYNLRAILNSALETEATAGGTSNDLSASAQSLDPVFQVIDPALDSSKTRATAIGTLSSATDVDLYSITLDQPGNLTVAVQALNLNASLTLLDSAENVIASGNGAINLDQTIANTPLVAGTYYLRIIGSAAGAYSLLVTRNSSFDTEVNDSVIQAQPLGPNQTAVGHVSSGGLNRLFSYDALSGQIREADTQTGLTIRSFQSPISAAAGPKFGMATSPNSLLIGGYSNMPIYELNPDTGGVIRTLANPGISISGMAFLNNEIYVLTDINQSQITVLNYATGAVSRTIFASANINGGLGASANTLYATNGAALYQISTSNGASTYVGQLTGVSYGQGVGVIGNELYISDYSVVRIFNLATLTPVRMLSGFGNSHATGADSPSDRDSYYIDLILGDQLSISTSTPAGVGSLLDPQLELFSPSSALLRSDNNSAADGRNSVLAYTATTTGRYVIRVSAVGTTAGDYTLSTQVVHPPLSASAGGPYSVNEGASISLNGAASSGAILSYTWDLDYDGVTFTPDASGISPAFPATGIDGPAIRTVALKVSDGVTESLSTATVNINNVAPSATLSAGPVVTLGSSSTVSFASQLDPSTADVTAGFSYSYDFNNDGDFADPGDVLNSTSATASYTFASAGTFNVRGRIADKDGGFTDYTTSVTVNPPVVSTVTLAPLADAYVRDGTYASTNFGADPAILLKKDGVGLNREAYFKFDLTTLTTITQAKVRLFGKLGGAITTPINMALYGVSDLTWGESTITYANKPATDAKSIATVPVTSNIGQWYEWDVTSYLQAAKLAGKSAVAFDIKALNYVSSQLFTANSRNATSNQPQLLVMQTPAQSVQGIVVSAQSISVPEGSSKTFAVQLAIAPAGNVTVDVTKAVNGDPDLTSSITQLTFTPANWNIAQTVTISAAIDADAINGSAVFTLGSAGLPSQAVTATEIDKDIPASQTLASIADAYVRDGSSANSNFGSDPALVLKRDGVGANREAYLKFDLTSLTTISQAKIRLFGKLGGAVTTPINLALYGVSDSSWLESGITFNNRPSADAKSIATVGVSSTVGQWYEWDVTAYLQAAKLAGRTAVSFDLRALNYVASQLFTANSRNATSNQPQMVVSA